MRAAYSHASTNKKSASLAFFVRNSLPLMASGMFICMCKLRLTGVLPMACISTILGSNTSVVISGKSMLGTQPVQAGCSTENYGYQASLQREGVRVHLCCVVG